jgi:hypothetical protein
MTPMIKNSVEGMATCNGCIGSIVPRPTIFFAW